MFMNMVSPQTLNVYPAPVTTCAKCGDPCDVSDSGICDGCVSVALDPMPTDPPTPNYAPYRCNGFCDCCHTFAVGVSLPYFNSVQGIYSALHKCDPCIALESKPKQVFFGGYPVLDWRDQQDLDRHDMQQDYALGWAS